jgi:hypothetical protein
VKLSTRDTTHLFEKSTLYPLLESVNPTDTDTLARVHSPLEHPRFGKALLGQIGLRS